VDSEQTLKKITNKKVREAVLMVLEAGYHLDVNAFNFLCTISKTKDPTMVLEGSLRKLETKSQNSFLIDESLLKEVANDVFPQAEEISQEVETRSNKQYVSSGKTHSFQPYSKNIDSQLKVIEDPTEEINSTGSIEECLEYFQDRFKKIRKLLRQRMDSRDAGQIKDGFRAPTRSKVKFICIVTEKRESTNGMFLAVEDLETATTVFVPRNSPLELLKKIKTILPDQVVCLEVIKGRGNFMIVQNIQFPDIPQKQIHRAQEVVNAALISDLHIGSKEFMKGEFDRFLLWLNGRFGNQRLKKIAGLVKYVIIAGDIVDGVGIYPDQIKDLSVPDISKQYKIASEFIEQIPDYIELIIIPGNHDASRKSLPQPSLPKEYVEQLCEVRNVFSLGNPAVVDIHGVEFLIYHGRSLDDVLATAPEMDFHSPELAMKLMLKCRHLAPSYGQRTSIAPANHDLLVIDRVPDIFHTGHVHVMKYEFYRNTLMVNSGAWQRQTSFQRNLGLEPTPGIIPVVNLNSYSVLPIDFNI
jgi:DNA polymerase II small subunit